MKEKVAFLIKLPGEERPATLTELELDCPIQGNWGRGIQTGGGWTGDIHRCLAQNTYLSQRETWLCLKRTFCGWEICSSIPLRETPSNLTTPTFYVSGPCSSLLLPQEDTKFQVFKECMEVPRHTGGTVLQVICYELKQGRKPRSGTAILPQRDIVQEYLMRGS